MKKIYVVSKYAGQVEINVKKAIGYCQYVIDSGFMPIASHLLYPQILNDDNPQERSTGCHFGLLLLEMCDEVWVFGTDYSKGMIAEINEANRLSKPIVYFNEDCVSINENDAGKRKM